MQNKLMTYNSFLQPLTGKNFKSGNTRCWQGFGYTEFLNATGNKANCYNFGEQYGNIW